MAPYRCCAKVRFTAPVSTGSRVRAQFRIVSVEDLPRGARFTTEATVECEGSSDKPVCVAELVGILNPAEGLKLSGVRAAA